MGDKDISFAELREKLTSDLLLIFLALGFPLGSVICRSSVSAAAAHSLRKLSPLAADSCSTMQPGLVPSLVLIVPEKLVFPASSIVTVEPLSNAPVEPSHRTTVLFVDTPGP